MIEGYFDPAGRPYVRAYLVVPGLQPAPAGWMKVLSAPVSSPPGQGYWE